MKDLILQIVQELKSIEASRQAGSHEIREFKLGYSMSHLSFSEMQLKDSSSRQFPALVIGLSVLLARGCMLIEASWNNRPLPPGTDY